MPPPSFALLLKDVTVTLEEGKEAGRNCKHDQKLFVADGNLIAQCGLLWQRFPFAKDKVDLSQLIMGADRKVGDENVVKDVAWLKVLENGATQGAPELRFEAVLLSVC